MLKVIKLSSIILILIMVILLSFSTLFYFSNNISLKLIYILILGSIYSLISFIIANYVHKKGLIIGLLVGLLLTSILITINLINKIDFSLAIFIKYLLCNILSLLFGCLGVNFKQILK